MQCFGNSDGSFDAVGGAAPQQPCSKANMPQTVEGDDRPWNITLATLKCIHATTGYY